MYFSLTFRGGYRGLLLLQGRLSDFPIKVSYSQSFQFSRNIYYVALCRIFCSSLKHLQGINELRFLQLSLAVAHLHNDFRQRNGNVATMRTIEVKNNTGNFAVSVMIFSHDLMVPLSIIMQIYPCP